MIWTRPNKVTSFTFTQTDLLIRWTQFFIYHFNNFYFENNLNIFKVIQQYYAVFLMECKYIVKEIKVSNTTNKIKYFILFLKQFFRTTTRRPNRYRCWPRPSVSKWKTTTSKSKSKSTTKKTLTKNKAAASGFDKER